MCYHSYQKPGHEQKMSPEGRFELGTLEGRRFEPGTMEGGREGGFNLGHCREGDLNLGHWKEILTWVSGGREI